ncbi:MAG: 1-acyl-sn-glycerol-3-phosphate acyltransferase [Phycisphaeraceae bacterium]|nr:1-acyl-sn-glycerol-3-phosphate acyltransferase [Phycisphaerales bacterium]MCB9860018.1 1-acyl-sn-glycerol-3-phosphate acyltransferase [Phycisphaeraceae bacterium]
MLIWTFILGLALVCLVTFAFVCQHLERNNPRHDAIAGMLYACGRWYVRRMHRLQVRSQHHLPDNPGPLIVIANHTAGIDPILIQCVCPFEIRWMMAADMRHPRGEPFWQWMKIIFVDRSRPDTNALRLAIRHVQAGGVLGIFPEGRIERPRGVLLPFQRGVGALVKQTGATVLPVLVEGTPPADTAWGSILKKSRSRVTFLAPVSYSDDRTSAQDIATDLESRIAGAMKMDSTTTSRAASDTDFQHHADSHPIDAARSRNKRHTDGGPIAAGM